MKQKTWTEKAIVFVFALVLAVTGLTLAGGALTVEAAPALTDGVFRVETPGYFHRNPFIKQGPDFLVLDVTVTNGAVSAVTVVSHLERQGPMSRAGHTREGTPWLYVSLPADNPWWNIFIGMSTIETVMAVEDVEGAEYTSQAFKDAIVIALQMSASTYTPRVFFTRGSGTAADPYIIATAAELQMLSYVVNHEDAAVSALYNAGHFRLANDIDLAGINWIPIGCNTTPNNRFRGTFDGDGHTIYNMTIRYTHAEPVSGGFVGVGLFGVFGINTTVVNVGLVNVDIEANLMFQGATHNAAIGVGALLGSSLNGGVAPHHVTVDRAFATGRIRVTNTTDPEWDGNINNANIMAGGLVGCIAGQQSSITNSWADVDVYARSENTAVVAGGLFGVSGHAGSHTRSEMLFFGANNAAFGNVAAYGGTAGKAGVRAAAGGLGGTVNGLIFNSFAFGNVTGNGHQVGLLAGRVNRGILIDVLYNDNAVLTRNLNPADHGGELVPDLTPDAASRGIAWFINVNAPPYYGAEANTPRAGGVISGVFAVPAEAMTGDFFMGLLNENMAPARFDAINVLMLTDAVLFPSPHGILLEVSSDAVASYAARINDNWARWRLVDGRVIPAPAPRPVTLPAAVRPADVRGFITTEGLVPFIPPVPVAGQDLRYTVQPGETLWGIAFNYYGSVAAVTRIINANPGVIPANGAVTPGMVIILPARGLRAPVMQDHLDAAAGFYLVRRGDTLAGIAAHFFGDSSLWREIRAVNSPRVGADNMIFEGQWLIIPQL